LEDVKEGLKVERDASNEEGKIVEELVKEIPELVKKMMNQGEQ
jgi:hypothetical protein